jgi:hypothetical protein
MNINWLSVRIPREPQEVHPWYQDGIWRIEEGQGQERLNHVSTCPCLVRTTVHKLASFLREETK